MTKDEQDELRRDLASKRAEIDRLERELMGMPVEEPRVYVSALPTAPAPHGRVQASNGHGAPPFGVSSPPRPPVGRTYQRVQAIPPAQAPQPQPNPATIDPTFGETVKALTTPDALRSGDYGQVRKQLLAAIKAPVPELRGQALFNGPRWRNATQEAGVLEQFGQKISGLLTFSDQQSREEAVRDGSYARARGEVLAAVRNQSAHGR